MTRVKGNIQKYRLPDKEYSSASMNERQSYYFALLWPIPLYLKKSAESNIPMQCLMVEDEPMNSYKLHTLRSEWQVNFILSTAVKQINIPNASDTSLKIETNLEFDGRVA